MCDPNAIKKERLIESLILDGSTHLWVAADFVPHIRRVLERLPMSALERLVEKQFRFLAPERVLGRVTRLDHPLGVGELVVFLSPELLSYSSEAILAVIAHELAHVVLGHEERLSDAREEANKMEREADDLTKSWGFELPQSFLRY